MIHLAGKNTKEKIQRGLEELSVYDSEGIDGAIIEDYHGTLVEVYTVARKSISSGLKLARGMNVLRDPYVAFYIAEECSIRFIQFDSVQTYDIDTARYAALRQQYPTVAVFGGVGFKYTKPTGNPLEQDLNEGKSRCEAIVTTGLGTGKETPIKKLKEFKKLLGKFPLIVGAGINIKNVREQLAVADGAIVGSYFKPNGDTSLPVDRARVRDLMRAVREIRDS